MPKYLKVTASVLLSLVFISACAIALVFVFLGAWLHTYRVFTERRLVAEVAISEIRRDEQGEYTVVRYTPREQQSALMHIFLPQSDQNTAEQTQEFKLYGDTVHIGGPIVKFHDHLILVNFKTMYKVGKIYGRYNFDNQKELNRKVQSSFDLNGGIDPTWLDMSARTESWPYTMFVDTTQLSIPGKEVPVREAKTYNLYITPTGFLWDLKN